MLYYSKFTDLQLFEYHKCITSLKVGDFIEYYIAYNDVYCRYMFFSWRDMTEQTNLAEVIAIGDNFSTPLALETFTSSKGSRLNLPKAILGSTSSSLWKMTELSKRTSDALRSIDVKNYSFFARLNTTLFIKRIIKAQ